MATHKPLWIVRKVPEHEVEPTLTRPMDDAGALSARVGPIVDSNIHLWDQSLNPVFGLSDRSMLRSMLGPYDSLPDRYVVEDYRQATAGLASAERCGISSSANTSRTIGESTLKRISIQTSRPSRSEPPVSRRDQSLRCET